MANDNYIKSHTINILRWVAVIPGALFTNVILYALAQFIGVLTGYISLSTNDINTILSSAMSCACASVGSFMVAGKIAPVEHIGYLIYAVFMVLAFVVVELSDVPLFDMVQLILTLIISLIFGVVAIKSLLNKNI